MSDPPDFRVNWPKEAGAIEVQADNRIASIKRAAATYRVNDDLIRTAVVSDRVVLTTANYNEMVIAIHAPIRDYERCVTASLGCDDCGAQLIEYR